jgi:hypothetical protein
MPQLHVAAIGKLLAHLSGFLIIGALDDFGWARGVIGSVDKIDAIRGHDRYSLQFRRERYGALSHRRLSVEPCR